MNFRVFTCATILFVAALAPRAAGYNLSGSKWTLSSVSMHLQLGAGSGVLLDGSPSWGAAAEDALSVWNSYIGATKFSVVRDSTAIRAQGNRINNVFFSSDVYGNAWGSGVLAVTLTYTSGTTQVETDVLFNNRLTWNSYRGPLRYTSGGVAILDFHRVALHEFGHVLGLGHPDDAGQTVSALMNSRISALDQLAADDIAGGQILYGPAVAVVPPPTITTQPTNRTVVAGQSTTFTVVASGTAPLTYQWLKNGGAISAATSATFSLASVSQNDAGNYSVAVSNAGGTVYSTAATLTVTAATTPTTPTTPTSPTTPTIATITPPAIAVAPASQAVNAGTTVSLYVVATGTPPFSYQWRKDGSLLSGATSSVLSLVNVQASQGGNYTVSVSNSAGTVTSADAVLAIHTLPVIVTPPADQTVPIGSRLRLSVVASATSSLSYSWRKDGTVLPGATQATYEVADAQPAHAGTYSVVVTSAAGAVTSPSARVTVVAVAPTVSSPPVAQTANAGDRATLTVAVNGTPPFTYQWFKDGREIRDANSATLNLSSVRAADGGEYSVRISNDAGSITSVPVMLTVKSSRLVNLSTRAFVPAGGTLTPGFFIRGSGSKALLIRAVGPTLRRFGIETALSATQLELVAQGSTVPMNRDQDYHAVIDNDAAASVGAFPLEAGARDSAVEATLTSRGYTVRVSSGEANLAGVSLAEIYDADTPLARAELVNLSTLGFVGSGENLLTAGFVISGNAPKRLLVRAVGPGLAPFGVADVLADPQLALLPQGSSEPLAMNDNWVDQQSVRAAFSVAGAFSLPGNSRDAALVVTLQPGAYTVVVSSVIASETGVALVELYDLDP